MFKLSRIGLKVSLLGSIFILGVIAMMATMILRRTEDAKIAEMKVRAEFFARSCGEAIFPHLDTFTLHFNTDEMHKEKAVVYVAVMDTSGKYLSHSDSKRIGMAVEDDVGRIASAATQTLVQQYAKNRVGYFDIATPIVTAKRRVGTVRLGFTRASMDEALRQDKSQIILIASCAIGIAILGTIFIVGWMMRPLNFLAQAAEDVGAGNLETQVRWKSRDELGALAKAFNKMIEGLKERERIRTTFGQFVAPEVAEMAIQGKLELAGQKRDVSILLVDIRNFTSFSENLPPEQVVAFLNDYFSQMVEIILKHKGNVDKFIGDAILAVFGAPISLPDHAARAVRCALEIKERLNQINAERRKKNIDPVRIGMAVNSGQVVAGTIGSRQRMEYTVIGDTVNLASRMEGINIKLGTEILVTQNTYSLTQGHMERGQGLAYKSWGLTKVRGRVEPVMVYELQGLGKPIEGPPQIIEERRKIYREEPEVKAPAPGVDATQVNVSGNFSPVIGPYQIEKELAKGGMGAVFLGHNTKTNWKAAIKTMKFGEDLSPQEAKDLRERFFREAEAAGRLTHPDIVKIYEVGEEQNVPYIAMEYLDGHDLVKFCEKSALLPIATTVDIVARIADALHYAHSQGVVHRDIKPGNVMILKDHQLRLMDFGIARIPASSHTATGTVLGTPSYMSPEQVSGKKVDARSDIFSLGVMLFEMLTGEKPFKGDGENLGTLLFQIALDPHPDLRKINPNAPPALVAVIDRALQKRKEDRFATAKEMADALRKSLTEDAAATGKSSQVPQS